jgi:hypothetical protein
MFRLVVAVAVAAACAAVFVGFVPPPTPALAAVESAHDNIAQAATPAPLSRGDVASAVCAQAWPYYETGCLRDSRRQDGRAAVVRVVAFTKPAANRVQQVQR